VKLLDLFCGEGGAATGYFTAGWDVHGVDYDNARLRHYPYDCDRADALDYLYAHGHRYDLIHASPPCTGYTRGTVGIKDRDTRYTRLIAATRAALIDVGKPWIIENVAGAAPEMNTPLLLCGRMFGLYTHDADGRLLVLDRHRLFESPLIFRQPVHPDHHRGKITVGGAYGGARNDPHEARYQRGGGYVPHPNIQRRLLGVNWMSPQGTALAIPPAYTRYLGKQAKLLLTH
jgi:DNA (cytosine-5)-methyltransferase 1